MSGLSEALTNLKLVIDETVKFPTEYLFKFIVPLASVHEILFILEGMQIEQTPSKNGNYISVSAKKVMDTSQDIITIYQRASVIKGIISL
jgi:putative lipoic acid-binding regulatory protein